MALPSSGPISMDQVRIELGVTGVISLNDSRVRDMAGRPSGFLSLSDLRGKSSFATTHIVSVVQCYNNARGYDGLASNTGARNPTTASNGTSITRLFANDQNNADIRITGDFTALYNRISIKDFVLDHPLAPYYESKTNETYFGSTASVAGMYAFWGTKLNTTLEIRLFKV
jgi:hypothetical protein